MNINYHSWLKNILIYVPSLLENLMIPRLLAPDLEIKNLGQLNIKKIKEIGIKYLILDVDNFLCTHHGNEFHPHVKTIIPALKKEFDLIILSNTSNERRTQLEEYFQIPVCNTQIKKPLSGAYNAAIRQMEEIYQKEKISLEEVAMGDDRLGTGIAGANRLGIYAIWAHPLDRSTDTKVISFIRNLEEKVLRSYQRKIQF